ncbi:MAG: hypothetical protein ACR2OV_08450, partial [Hyphomicrobiaceae bacterium]
ALKMRVQSIEALDAAVGTIRRGLKLTVPAGVLQDAGGKTLLAELASLLRPGNGQIRIAVSMPDSQKSCELLLNGLYDTGPQARGSLGTLDGLTRIEELLM